MEGGRGRREEGEWKEQSGKKYESGMEKRKEGKIKVREKERKKNGGKGKGRKENVAFLEKRNKK